jgi:integral membrane sensor domain MASE1
MFRQPVMKAAPDRRSGHSNRPPVVVYPLSLRQLALLVFLAFVYLGVARLNLKLSLALPFVTPIWIPAGIALAALVLYGYRVWPAIFAGAFLFHLTLPGSTLLTPLGATVAALAGAYLVGRFANGERAFDSAKDVFRFVFWGCLCSPLIGQIPGVVRLYLLGGLHLGEAVLVLLTWWLAQGVGILVIAPFLILLLRSAPKLWSTRALGELALLLLGLVFICLLVFGPLSRSLNKQNLVTAWLCIPFLIWAGFRFRPLEATGTTLILFGSAIWGTVQGYGSFTGTSLTKSLFLLDTFIAVIGTMTLVIAAMVAERKLAAEKLLESQRLLRAAAEEKEQALIVTVQALEIEVSGHVQTRTALQALHERLRRIAPNRETQGEI